MKWKFYHAKFKAHGLYDYIFLIVKRYEKIITILYYIKRKISFQKKKWGWGRSTWASKINSEI